MTGTYGPYSIYVLGCEGVGKTAIVVRYLTKRFLPEYCHADNTVYERLVVVDDKPVQLKIHNPTGKGMRSKLQEKSTFTKTDGFIVAYDITNRASFEGAMDILDIIKRETKSDRSKERAPPTILVGTKTDLNHLRKVSSAEAHRCCWSYVCCTFQECSAASWSSEVEQIFLSLIRKMMEKNIGTPKRRRKISAGAMMNSGMRPTLPQVENLRKDTIQRRFSSLIAPILRDRTSSMSDDKVEDATQMSHKSISCFHSESVNWKSCRFTTVFWVGFAGVTVSSGIINKMGLGGCYSCIKYLMFAFNFLFWLVGCAILGVAIWVRVDPDFKKYVEGNFEQLYTGAYILMGIGVLIMIIGFLGCCGAIKESQCMLATFFVLLFLIFAILVAAGVYALVQQDDLKSEVNKVLQGRVADYHQNEGSKTFMDNIQVNFKCCGASAGSGDYLLTGVKDLFGGNKVGGIPETCGDIVQQVKPCTQQMFDFLKEHVIIIAGVAIGIGVVMVLGMTFSCLLCCVIRRAESHTV
ncbi:unnamed protein product [Owenia fusiformis]|uniref:small monomeric GTPase n=1 Tax=Owenia fusiformis TaxID=6347 RepID=A0A8S4P504_OWEFU|nr:unnamed protein product [Owenia fusiformis]